MADDEAGRRAALDELLPLQQADFEGLFEAMDGPAGHDPAARPAAARVPARPRRARRAHRRGARCTARRRSRRSSTARAHARARGGQPDARHARRAARPPAPRDLRDAGARDLPRRARRARAQRPRAGALEIMIPLVAYARELELARDAGRARRRRGGLRARRDFEIGTMIELPRACLARRRDRARTPSSSRSAPTTSRRPRSASRATTSRAGSSRSTSTPGSSSARRSGRSTSDGVGELVAHRGRARPRRAARTSRLGICGEHGGDPDSIRFFHARRPRLRELLAVPRPDRARRRRAGGSGV